MTPRSTNWIELFPLLKDQLRGEQKRTGICSDRLLDGRDDIPGGLSAKVIDLWLAKSAKRAEAQQYEYVMSLYRALPSQSPVGKRPLNRQADRVPVTEELRAQLRLIHTHAPANYLLAAPDTFTPSKMSHVLSGRDKTIPKDALDYVLSFAKPC
ncbi:MAG: hypothetical protein AAFV07_21370 [Bacteroidota bacterium]